MLLSLLSSAEVPQSARLESLLIFNPKLGGESDAERKVLFCHPPDVPLEEQLRALGLCEALVALSRRFSRAPCEAVRTANRRYSLLEAEPDIWFCLVTLHATAPAAGGLQTAADDALPDALLRERLQWLHATLRMFAGNLAAFGTSRADELRRALRASAGPLVSLCEGRGLLALSNAPLGRALSAVRTLSLPRALHLTVLSSLHDLQAALDALSQDGLSQGDVLSQGGALSQGDGFSQGGALSQRGPLRSGEGVGMGDAFGYGGGAALGGSGSSGGEGSAPPAACAADNDPSGSQPSSMPPRATAWPRGAPAPAPAIAVALVLHSEQLVWSGLGCADTRAISALLTLLLSERSKRGAERGGAGAGGGAVGGAVSGAGSGGGASSLGRSLLERFSLRSTRATGGDGGALHSARAAQPSGAVPGTPGHGAAGAAGSAADGCSGGGIGGDSDGGTAGGLPPPPGSAAPESGAGLGAPAEPQGLGEACSARVRARLCLPCAAGSLVIGGAGQSANEQAGGRDAATATGAEGGAMSAPLVWLERLPPALRRAAPMPPTLQAKAEAKAEVEAEACRLHPARLLIFRLRELTVALLAAEPARAGTPVSPAATSRAAADPGPGGLAGLGTPEGAARAGWIIAGGAAAVSQQWAERARASCTATLAPAEAALSDYATRVRGAAAAEAAAGAPGWAQLDEAAMNLRGSLAVLGGGAGTSDPKGSQAEQSAFLLRACALLASSHEEAAREQAAATAGTAPAPDAHDGARERAARAAASIEVCARGRRPGAGWVVGRKAGARTSLLLLDAKGLPSLEDAHAAEAAAWRLEAAEAAGRPLAHLLNLGRGVLPSEPVGSSRAELGASAGAVGVSASLFGVQQRTPSKR